MPLTRTACPCFTGYWVPAFHHHFNPIAPTRLKGSVLCEAFESRKGDDGKVLLQKRGSEIASNLKGSCIYLVGMIGSKKRAIGQTLAEAVGYNFFDSDELIEQAAGDGRTVSQMLVQEDEKGFRDAETEVLKQLSCMLRLVVATGDGAVLRPMNWSYMRHGVVVWLDVPVETLVVENGDKPAQSQTEENLRDTFKIRQHYYAESDATVSLQKVASQTGSDEVECLPPTMVALEVLEEIDKLIKYKK